MADNEEAILKEAKKLSVEDRLGHKHWKARVQVLEEIAAACADAKDPKDAKVREYGKFCAVNFAMYLLNQIASSLAWALAGAFYA